MFGEAYDAFDRTIDSHIKNLRRKLGERDGAASTSRRSAASATGRRASDARRGPRGPRRPARHRVRGGGARRRRWPWRSPRPRSSGAASRRCRRRRRPLAPGGGPGPGRGPGHGRAPAWVRAPGPTRPGQQETTTTIILVAIAAAALASLLGVLIARRIAEPLVRLEATAAAVAHGDLAPARGSSDRGDEIGSLGRSFDAMAADLERDEASRRRFFQDAAHEMKTPLAVIEATAAAVMDGVYEHDDRHLETIREQARLLGRVVDDLRTISLADAGALPLSLGDVRVDEVDGPSSAAFAARRRPGASTLPPGPAPVPPLTVRPTGIGSARPSRRWSTTPSGSRPTGATSPPGPPSAPGPRRGPR